MIYLESPSTDACFNLALEEYVFERMDPSMPYFLLWQNANAVIVGKYQNTAEEINQAYVDRCGIQVVRRLSGGGAVYHDMGNLNFTFIVDRKNLSDFNFKVFVLPVIRVLEKIGVHAAFNGRNDVTIDGAKFSGNSQYAKRGRVLHHGCIMLSTSADAASCALKTRDAKFASKSAKSVRSRITTINEHAPVPIDMDAFKRMLKEDIAQHEDLQEICLTEEQLADIRALADSKYASWDWNYGASPAYNMQRERKFATGLVTLYLEVEDGCIKNARFYGDFFANADLGKLEAAMRGLRLDAAELHERLCAINAGDYISGISVQDLFELLVY